METATFAGGCFWCTEAVFKRLKGVVSVNPGYTGGSGTNPRYEEVATGQTGHAEAIQIIFDSSVIPYSKLLEIFWHTHNPTTLNQQGADIGTQYRSEIFYHSEKQKKEAEHSKEQLEKDHVFTDTIVTLISPFKEFYAAESYHKDYYDLNQNKPYCTFVINPKLQKLLKEFSSEVKDEYK